SALVAALNRTRVMTGAEILRIGALNGEYYVEPKGQPYSFDHLVIATNARVASELVSGLPGATDAAAVLGGVGYYPTQIAIHGDRRWMPANERHWSVVNFRYDGAYGAISVWTP